GKLPRRRRAASKEEMPRDVDLERRVGVFRDDVLVAGQVHHVVVVLQNGRWGGAKNRDFGSGTGHFKWYPCPHGPYSTTTIVATHIPTQMRSGRSLISRSDGLPPSSR